MIRDPDADAEVREIERDLLDAAAAGTLDPARQALVEERLMQDPRNRGAVALAQALAEHHARSSTDPAHDSRIAAAAAAGDVDADPSHAARFAASVWHPWMWAAAAALIAALALGPFMLRTSRDTHETSRSSNAVSTAPIAPPASVDPAAPPALPPTLPPPDDSARAGSPAKDGADLPRDPSRIVALVLPAGTLRGGRPSVTLPREAETLRLEIELDDGPRPPGEVTVMLRALIPASSSVSASEWRWTSRVRVRVDNDQPIAVALVPARSIPTGPMEATITWPRGAPRVIPFLVRRN